MRLRVLDLLLDLDLDLDLVFVRVGEYGVLVLVGGAGVRVLLYEGITDFEMLGRCVTLAVCELLDV